MTKQREQFQERVASLVKQVKGFVEPHQWVTRSYMKKMRDDENLYEVESLFLQKGSVRLLLDPIAYDVPGANGVVDLYLMPTYDDMASIYFEQGGWMMHYTFPPDATEARSVIATTVLPVSEATINKVLDSIAANAEPSF